IRFTRIPLEPQINRSQSFFSLSGSSVTAEQVPLEFRPVLTTQLTSQPPQVWTEYQRPPDTRVATTLPTAVEVTPTATPSGSQVCSLGLTVILTSNATPTPTYVLHGPEAVTITRGVVGVVQPYSPTQTRTIDTNITDVLMPDDRNPNATVNRSQNSNPLELV